MERCAAGKLGTCSEAFVLGAAETAPKITVPEAVDYSLAAPVSEASVPEAEAFASRASVPKAVGHALAVPGPGVPILGALVQSRLEAEGYVLRVEARVLAAASAQTPAPRELVLGSSVRSVEKTPVPWGAVHRASLLVGFAQ